MYMDVITHYDVGVVLYQNNLQCVHIFTTCYIAIHHLLIKYIIFDTNYFADLYVNIAQKIKHELNGQHLEDGHHIYHITHNLIAKDIEHSF